jgi:hypothetical protein
LLAFSGGQATEVPKVVGAFDHRRNSLAYGGSFKYALNVFMRPRDDVRAPHYTHGFGGRSPSGHGSLYRADFAAHHHADDAATGLLN